MKRLLQTSDKRTVKRRMDKLEKNADAWGITGWVRNTQAHLEQLLPAVGSRVLPTTTNAIERFFGHFARFYKPRNGFHCVDTAKDQLALFLTCLRATHRQVGYLLSKRAKDGIAPIETIWPEAVYTPLYQTCLCGAPHCRQVFNDPFCLGIHPDYVKQMPRMANESSSYLLQA